MGLQTNVCKTVGMMCRPFREAGVLIDKAYHQRMTGEGRSFKERQQEWVLCTECGEDLDRGSLVTHRQIQHGVAKGGLGSEGDKADEGNNPRTYRLAFPARAGPRPCLVEGCSDWASTRTAMRVHFWNRHVMDNVVILEEDTPPPHPRCPLCDMLVPWNTLNGTHRHTEQCTQGAERKRRRLAVEKEREVTARAFSAYGRPLEMVTYFKYLGRVILEADDKWLAVVKIFSPAKKVWSRMSCILSRDGAAPLVSGFSFKAMVQAVLLFGAETWLVTPTHGQGPGGFHN